MQIAFATPKLRQQLGTDAAVLKSFGWRATKVAQRLHEIIDADNLEILTKLPALDCRPLGANPAGNWVLNVTNDYLMIFSLDQTPVPRNEEGLIDKKMITRIRIEGFA